MKNLAFYLAVMISMTALSQESISINQDFAAIRVSSGMQVEMITEAEENKIEASSQVIDILNYKVKDNELRLGVSLDALIEGNIPFKLKLYVKSLESLNAVQGSYVEIENNLKTNVLSLRASEGSSIIANIEVGELDVKVLSGSIIELEGNAKEQVVFVKTGGIYEGQSLVSEDAVVEASYGGEAEINVSNNCEAKVILGGIIDVYGKPKFMNKKTSFGGDINVN